MSKTFDRYASVALFIVGIGFILESMNISETAYGSNVGPNIFPMGLGVVLVLLCIRLFYETFRYQQAGSQKQPLDKKRFLLILGAAVLYAWTLETVGYVITTFFFLLFAFQVMERGGWWKSVLIAALFSGGIYTLFVEVMDGTLPGFPVWFQ
jgi:putative tricarboxylic transport membrane protein